MERRRVTFKTARMLAWRRFADALRAVPRVDLLANMGEPEERSAASDRIAALIAELERYVHRALGAALTPRSRALIARDVLQDAINHMGRCDSADDAMFSVVHADMLAAADNYLSALHRARISRLVRAALKRRRAAGGGLGRPVKVNSAGVLHQLRVGASVASVAAQNGVSRWTVWRIKMRRSKARGHP